MVPAIAENKNITGYRCALVCVIFIRVVTYAEIGAPDKVGS